MLLVTTVYGCRGSFEQMCIRDSNSSVNVHYSGTMGVVIEGCLKAVSYTHLDVYKRQVQNPVNYYFMDLSAEDYDKMIQIAANHGKVFD